MTSSNHTTRPPSVKTSDDANIMRAAHERNFFSMARSTAQNRELSLLARAIMAYLLSKPDDWRVQPKDLQQGIGRNKVYEILNELVEAKYIKKTQVIDEKNRFKGYSYTVYETPYSVERETETEKASTASASEQKQDVPPFPEKPYSGNRDITEYRDIQNTENTSADVPSEVLKMKDARIAELEKRIADLEELAKSLQASIASSMAPSKEVLALPEVPPSPPPLPAPEVLPVVEKPKAPRAARPIDLIYDVVAKDAFKQEEGEKPSGYIAVVVFGPKNKKEPGLVDKLFKGRTPTFEEAETAAEELHEAFAWWGREKKLSAPSHAVTIHNMLLNYKMSPAYRNRHPNLSPDGMDLDVYEPHETIPGAWQFKGSAR